MAGGIATHAHPLARRKWPGLSGSPRRRPAGRPGPGRPAPGGRTATPAGDPAGRGAGTAGDRHTTRRFGGTGAALRLPRSEIGSCTSPTAVSSTQCHHRAPGSWRPRGVRVGVRGWLWRSDGWRYETHGIWGEEGAGFMAPTRVSQGTRVQFSPFTPSTGGSDIWPFLG